ncbi:hypothetical protein [Aquipuribacter sp. SD81]|uniref:hypothetical protein n=1 Tax=Aquipuribacter sp. SD81 TaxID=3127703 RepID=UPI0030190481
MLQRPRPELDLASTDQPMRLVFAPSGAELEAALECEGDVFEQRFGESREHLRGSLAAHEDTSVFLAVLASDGTAVAASRLVTPGSRRHKTLDYLAEAPWGLDADECADLAGVRLESTYDVATLCVRPRSEGEGALWTAALCHGMFQIAKANGVSHTVALLDEGARARLAAVGIIYTAFPGASPQPFDGSPATTPVYASMTEMVERQRRDFPEAYALIGKGLGLSGVHVPSLEHFRVPALPVTLDVRESRWDVAAAGLEAVGMA